MKETFEDILSALKKPFERPEQVFFWAFVAAVVYTVGFPALDNFFIHDDADLIIDTKEVFARPYVLLKTYNAFFRPAVRLTFYPFVQVFGNNPGLYYHLNLIVHFANSLLVYLVLGKLGFSWNGRTLGAAVFALNLMYLEIFRFIANYNELSFAFFSLLAFFLYINSEKTKPFAAVAFLTAAFSKESGIVLAFVLLAYEIIYGKRALIEKARAYLPTAAAAVIFITAYIARGFVVGKFAQTPYKIGFHVLYNLALNLVFIMTGTFYSLATCLKSGPAKYIVFSVLLAFITVLVFVTLIKRADRLKPAARPIALGFIWVTLNLLPATFWEGMHIGAGRYLYVPFVGVAIIVAAATDVIAFRVTRTAKITIAVIIIIYGLLVGALSYRTKYYENASAAYKRWYETILGVGTETTDYIILAGSRPRLSTGNIVHGKHDVALYKLMFPEARAKYLKVGDPAEAYELAEARRPSVVIVWSNDISASVIRYGPAP